MAAAEAIGIPQLDRLLPSIPAHATVALVNDPGVEAEPFLYQSTHEHLKNKVPVVYAVFNRPPSSVIRGMTEFGFDAAKGQTGPVFIDAFSPLLGGTEGAPYEVAKVQDLGLLADALTRAARQHPNALLILDAVSSVLDHVEPKQLAAALPKLQEALRQYRMVLAMVTRWPYGEPLDQLLKLFDGLVNLRAVEDRVMLNQYFQVDRAAWSPHVDGKPVLFRAIRPGGVFVYIPKILVTGAYHAGKSTLVQTLSDSAVSVDRMGTTVALDHGHITIDGLTADIFGTPGQERFDPLLKTLAGQALGVILVVDSTRPESFTRAREMIALTGKEALPTIVAANKQDAPDALPLEEVAHAIGAPAHVRVVPCTATNKESARTVLRALLEQIMKVKS